MSLARTRLIAGTATLLALVSSLQPCPALAQQGDIGLKAGDGAPVPSAQFPGNLTAWAKTEQLRFVSEAPPKDVATAGKPPRPGLVSCAGKIEGRYAAAGAMPVQMTFRSGKVTLSMMGDNQTGECWTSGGKIFITLIGEEGAMEIDINDDGSLQAPFGELTKKGK